ncbi:MAG: MotA/TolQ/ExbB proton channel family protein, partial [Bacteroides sp.]|nr:MotA/TolQ/ExbB proton channel family protein [Bacteroides sp.]
SLAIIYLKDIIKNGSNKAHIQRMLANFEIEADKDLSLSKTLTKLGPILGLMGTLIPMGPALAGLASGDIASMAYNMQIAFATTVVGLVAGAIGFITQQTKQRWYLQDMTNLEFVAELLRERHEHKGE